MSRIAPSMLFLALSLAPVLCWAAEPNADQAKAIAEIEKLGGRVAVDGTAPGRPAVHLTLGGPKSNDAGLIHLNRLTGLRSLDLRGTKVTDAGLINLTNLKNLESLCLDNTQVAGLGLEHIRGCARLRDLSLRGTKIDDVGLFSLQRGPRRFTIELGNGPVDAGLEAFEAFTQLQSLKLDNTRITDAEGRQGQACTLYY